MKKYNKHEIKSCPRCNSKFECKPGNITQCQCFDIELTLKDEAFIKALFEDCLCADCLMALKKKYHETRIFDYYSLIKNGKR